MDTTCLRWQMLTVQSKTYFVAIDMSPSGRELHDKEKLTNSLELFSICAGVLSSGHPSRAFLGSLRLPIVLTRHTSCTK